MSRPITIIKSGIIKSQQSINHQNHISRTSTNPDLPSSPKIHNLLFQIQITPACRTGTKPEGLRESIRE